MRLLIAEDEEDLLEALCYGLRKRGYAVDGTGNGMDAVDLCEINNYDLMILDLNLPGLDGMEVLKHIRSQSQRKNTRVLILSARSGFEDKIMGLNEGASDYLTKPFHFGELEARVQALLRRNFSDCETVLCRGKLKLDTIEKKVSYNDRLVENLSMREFAILEYLLANAGRPVSAEELLEHVWDNQANPFTNQIKVYISNIRRKLSQFTEKPIIKSIRGAGYLIEREKPS